MQQNNAINGNKAVSISLMDYMFIYKYFIYSFNFLH
jgi:hypothetical protein